MTANVYHLPHDDVKSQDTERREEGLHGQPRLDEKGSEGDNVHACVMLGYIHDNLQKEGCEWDSVPEPPVHHNREDGNDCEDNRASCSISELRCEMAGKNVACTNSNIE